MYTTSYFRGEGSGSIATGTRSYSRGFPVPAGFKDSAINCLYGKNERD
jgi:hypothetical protein